jgi:cephalosporin hydroxylase
MATPDVCEEYHRWYYDNKVWEETAFLGVPCYKSVSDMWNYQEIITQLRPGIIVEFGTLHGGSALFFSVIGRSVNPLLKVLSVDVHHHQVEARVLEDPAVHLLTASSVDSVVADTIDEMRAEHPHPVFFVLDSDHRKSHVLGELELIRRVTRPGDYVIVEDGNINGHPVMPGWGDGPTEAISEYLARYPEDYMVDLEREKKFGFTFAPGGFLVRR